MGLVRPESVAEQEVDTPEAELNIMNEGVERERGGERGRERESM